MRLLLAQHQLPREGAVLPMLMAFGFSLGMAWGFLPPGLEFDPVAREAASKATGHGMFARQWIPLIGLGLAAVALRFRLATLILREFNPWLLLLPAWAVLSLLWAPDPFKVLKQSFGITGLLILALGFMLHGWHADRFVTVMRFLITASLAASLVLGIAMPDIGIHSEQQFELSGSWRGVTYQKNSLGQVASVGIILWFHAWASRSAPMRVVVPSLCLAAALLLLSRSSTSLLLSLFCCGVILLRLRAPLRLGKSSSIVAVAGWLLVSMPLFIYLIVIGSPNGEVIAQTFAQVFGKDATFSGRTLIWAEVLRNIEQHPFLGVGFNSFWHTPLADESIKRLGWFVPSGHNGYLDLLNTLGIVGLAMLAALLVRQFLDISRLTRVDYSAAALHFALLLYVILANLTESGWFVPISFIHIIAMYSSVCVSRLLFDARLRIVSAQANPSSASTTSMQPQTPGQSAS